MRIAICSSKNWFKLKPSISDTHFVNYFKDESDLTVEALEEFNPDYVFFTHWNWIVRKEIHENFNCVVFHTAPLPYGRGGSPIQNLILEGFEEAPVCAIKMIDELDAGPIYASTNVSLAGKLEEILLRINDAINDLIVEITTDNPNASPQCGEPHIFKRLKITDNEIQTGLNLEEIYDRIRMVDHEDYPNAFITYDKIKIEFSNAELVGDTIEVACVIKKLT